MSDTPRTDAVWNAPHYEDGACESALYSLAQDLERELAVAVTALKKDSAIFGIDCAATEALKQLGAAA